MMSTIEPSGSNPYEALGLTQKNSEVKEGNGLQDQFMTLMLTQMKNQDPLKPMENGDFLAQLAQFNTVSGIQDLQKSFADFASSMQTNQALQASSLVGREILIGSDTGVLQSNGMIDGQIDLNTSTPLLSIEVQDQAGQVVRQINMGSQSAGDIPFSWDGMAEDGTPMPLGIYKIHASALIDGKQVAQESAVYTSVESVKLMSGSREIELNAMGVGPVAMSQVIQVR
jgi:flagellar basal-body rod modification protein FlgD